MTSRVLTRTFSRETHAHTPHGLSLSKTTKQPSLINGIRLGARKRRCHHSSLGMNRTALLLRSTMTSTERACEPNKCAISINKHKKSTPHRCRERDAPCGRQQHGKHRAVKDATGAHTGSVHASGRISCVTASPPCIQLRIGWTPCSTQLKDTGSRAVHSPQSILQDAVVFSGAAHPRPWRRVLVQEADVGLIAVSVSRLGSDAGDPLWELVSGPQLIPNQWTLGVFLVFLFTARCARTSPLPRLSTVWLPRARTHPAWSGDRPFGKRRVI